MSDPIRRALRTMMWVLVASAPGIPTAAAAFNLSAGLVAKVTAVVGLLTGIVTFIVNQLEDSTAMPALLKSPASEGVNPQPDA